MKGSARGGGIRLRRLTMSFALAASVARGFALVVIASGCPAWSSSTDPAGKDPAAGPERAATPADREEGRGERAAVNSVSLERGRVETPSGSRFDVEVVSDERARGQGLKYRSSVPPGTGMLFVFPAPGPYRFWMYECLTALDIIWLDAQRRVVHVAERLPPCRAQPCLDYGPDKDALYVLEVGPGVAAKAGIRTGVTLTLLFADPPHPR